MSKSTAKYRSSLRRFNSKSFSRKQKDIGLGSINSNNVDYNQFNKSTGKHEVKSVDGVNVPVNIPQNKPMGVGDSGYLTQDYFVL